MRAPQIKLPDVKVGQRQGRRRCAGGTAAKAKANAAIKVKVQAPEIRVKAPEVKVKGQFKAGFKVGN